MRANKMGVCYLKKAIFLDRDGVLNHVKLKQGKPYPPNNLHELTIPEDVPNALSLLKSEGYLLIGATNQPDVARGVTTRSIVEAIHDVLMAVLPLDEIRVCYHDDIDHCLCRKPLPGMLLAAASDHGIDLTKSIMIGDRWKDIEAGLKAGCQTIWMDCDYEELKPTSADFTAKSLKDAAQWIISRR